METAPPVENIIHAVQTLYHNPDAAEKGRASTWLGQFQGSVHAWTLSDQLLREKQNVETCYFAAQTMRTKIQFSFHELPADSHQSLRDSLINHVEALADPNYQVILTQLCLALADLALQMVQWKNCAGDLIQRFSGNEAHIPLLMELLTVLPEEIHSRALRLGLNRREEFTQELGTAAPTVLNLMTVCSERYLTDERLLGKVFKCLASWFYLGVVPSGDIAGSKLLSILIQILKKFDTPSMLHEAASDCVCSALYAMEDIDDHLVLAEALYRGIMELQEAYALTVAEEDVDKAINYCRIFTELGEAFMEVMVDSPGQGLGDLKILDSVLNCVGHCQYEVAEITFNFWYRLSEILYKRDNKMLNDVFRPYIERLIHSLGAHCQMDPDHEGIPDEHDDFGNFRIRVSELIKDVIFLVGSSTCFGQMFSNLASQQGVTWDITEASLYVMTAVAKNVLPDETQVVPQVIQAIINLPEDTHIAVKHTSIHMIGELSEWIEKHPEVLEPVLNFLTSGLRHEDLASVAATSIQNICSQCQSHMKDHCDGLLQIAQALDAFNLSNEAAVGIIKGTAIVLAGLPIDKVEAGLKQLVLVQVNPLSQILKSDCEGWRYKAVQGTRNDPTLWLDRLAAIFRNANPQITNGQVHPCQTILQEIWPVLSETFTKFQREGRIIERCCRCVRFAVRCVGKGSAVLLTPLVTQMVTIYGSYSHSCFLYLGSILVDEYGGEAACIPGLVDMLQAFIQPTFLLFQEEHGVRNHPDTVDDFFRLCTRFIQRCPIALLQSTAIEPILQCGIAASKLDHRDANASVSKFFHELIHSGQTKWEAEDYQSRKALVGNLVKQNGAAMVQGIIDACVFYLPPYMMPDHSEVLFDLMQVDRQLVCTWLETSLKSLPAEFSDGRINATQKQLTDFHKAVTSAEDQKAVTYAVRDFCRLFSSFAYTRGKQIGKNP